MNFEQLNFKKNPKFQFKEIISDKREGFGTSSLFEIFKDKKDEIYIAAGYFDIKNPKSKEYHISLISLKDNQEKKKLEMLNSRLKVIRYFINPNEKDEAYLVCADRNSKIYIWDINNDYKKVYEKQLSYNHNISDILMIFVNNNKYIVISSTDKESYTIVLNIKEEEEEKQNQNEIRIDNSYGIKIYNLSYWYNEYNNNHYIIHCGQCKVLINEFQNKEKDNYATIDTGEEYPVNLGSIVFKRNNMDFLCFSSQFGLIIIYDLLNKSLVKKFVIKKAYLINVVKLNENYLIIIDDNKKSIIVIDVIMNKIISFIKIKEIFSHERYMRKTIHPLYGESLISIGNDWKIKLYTI